METPMMLGPEKEACGACGACGVCGACGTSPALFIAGAAIAALIALRE